MAQARRRKTRKSAPGNSRPRISGSGLGMLLTGMVVGSVMTSMFLGWKQDPEHGFGSGINQMIEKSRQATANPPAAAEQSVSKPTAAPSYDFYTILPEIEQVIPEEYVPPPEQPAQKPAGQQAESKPAQQDHYILQVGSFGISAEADELKARLALSGYEAYIQKVTVDGKRFYRVRMGPFRNLDKLDRASADLTSKGLNTLRIKVSSG